MQVNTLVNCLVATILDMTLMNDIKNSEYHSHCSSKIKVNVLQLISAQFGSTCNNITRSKGSESVAYLIMITKKRSFVWVVNEE